MAEYFASFTENAYRVLNLPIVSILFLLVIVWLVGGFFERIKLPAVLGELLAGVIIGPAVLNIIGPSEGLEFVAKLGMFFLMFYAGLQTDPKKLFRTRKKIILIGLFGTIVPFALGTLAVIYLGGSLLQGIFIGAAISGTSLVTKSRILGDLNLLKTKFGYKIMGSAMIDNMISFVILAVAIKAIITGKFALFDSVVTLTEASLFFIISLFIGYKFYPYITKFMKQKTVRGFTFAIIVGLFFAFFAEMMRIHFIIGAYLAGLMVREEITGTILFNKLKERFNVITNGFLGPLFIIYITFKVNFSALGEAPLMFFAIFIAAFVGKVLGAGIGAYIGGMKFKDSLTVGYGMNGRGTVELILAIVGFELGILNQSHLTILVLVAFLTTLIVPFALTLRMNRLSSDLLKKQ
ncbi:cation:proton antiporter [Patescibacteria group bacterium]